MVLFERHGETDKTTRGVNLGNDHYRVHILHLGSQYQLEKQTNGCLYSDPIAVRLYDGPDSRDTHV